MKRLLTLGLMVLLLVEPAFAGKGSSSFSGGSSRPSGGSSSRPSGGSSWGGSSSKPSGGSSWSGGSSSKPMAAPSPSPSRPSGGSGSSSKPDANKSSWSGGSTTTRTTTPLPDKKPVSVSKRPAAPSFDQVGIADAKKAESRANYEKATAPAPTYKTPKGTEAKIDPKDKENEYLRGKLDQQKWVNRQQREDQFYGRFNGPQYPPMVFGDPYHPRFNYWLGTQPLDVMALMILHHESSMERERIRDLYARNAQLEARVSAMRPTVTPNPTWLPPGADDDLYYDQGYVNATFNPKPKEETEYEYDSGITWGGFWGGVWWLIKWTFYIVLSLVVLATLFRVGSYYLFERRYN